MIRTLAALSMFALLFGGAGCASNKSTSAKAANEPTSLANPFNEIAPDAYRMDQLDSPMQLLDREPIDFPEQLRYKRKEGQVNLLVLVDKDGQVIACMVEDADHDEVAEHVRAEIVTRRFTVPMANGVPVQAYARLPVPYRIGAGSLQKLIKETEWESSPRK